MPDEKRDPHQDVTTILKTPDPNPIGAAIMRAKAAHAAAAMAVYTRAAVINATAAIIVANLVTVTRTGTAHEIEDTIRAIPLPTEAEILAYALELPRIRALVDLVPEMIASLRSDGMNVSLVKEARDALTALEPKT